MTAKPLKARAASLMSETDHESDDEAVLPLGDPADVTKSLPQLLHEGKKALVLQQLQTGPVTLDELTATFDDATVLGMAAFLGYEDIVGDVLARQEVYDVPKYMVLAAFKAIEKNQVRTLQLLCAANPHWIPSLQTPFTENVCPLLHFAAFFSANAVLAWVLQQPLPTGAVNAMDDTRQTPLYFANYESNFRGMKLLLRAGANVHEVDQQGHSALCATLLSVHNLDGVKLKIVMLLFAYGADLHPREVGSKKMYTGFGLSQASRVSKSGQVHALLRHEDAFRREFPLHCLARDNNVSGVRAWLDETLAATHVNAYDDDDDEDAAEPMTAINAALSAPDKDGKTALIYAADAIDGAAPTQVLEILLPHASTASLMVQDKNGRTVLDCLLEKDLVCNANLDDATNAAILRVMHVLTREKMVALDFVSSASVPRQGTQPLTCTGVCSETSQLSSTTLPQLAEKRKWSELERRLEASNDISTINEYDAKGHTVLYHVCDAGNDGLLALLLQQSTLNVNLTMRDSSETAVAFASARGHDECVRLLLRAGAHHGIRLEASAKDLQMYTYDRAKPSRTLLHESWLLEKAYPDYHLARLLNVHEAERHIEALETALHIAITNELPENVVESLLGQHSADVDAQTKITGETALMMAAKQGCMRLAQVLLEADTDVDVIDANKCTALLHAAVLGHVGIVELLLVYRADLDPKL
ncbi:hypothetical protein SDRG_12921, partial [Saprolegnia diclina VS20]